MFRRIPILVTSALVVNVFLVSQTFAGGNPTQLTTFFNQLWLKAVVSIEQAVGSNKYQAIGTGFLVGTKNKHIILVTAKHVVTDKQGNTKKGLAYLMNLKDEKSKVVTDAKMKELGLGDWFIAEDADVAARFTGRFKTSDIATIDPEMFLKKESIQAGSPALTLGFPTGLRSKEYAIPVVRRAMVAIADAKRFIVDGFVFPGNSGGPVVYMPAFQIGNIALNNYIQEQRLIGLVSSYIPYMDTAISLQTKRPRIIFEENSGLANVVPADAILKLIEREDMQALDKVIPSG